MYIQPEDFKGRISSDLLDMATEEDEDILAYCSKIAEDSIKGYIGHMYDITAELAKTALDRNFQLLSWALSIAVYHIFLRLPDVDIPEKVSKDYEGCLGDLENISKGKFTINLASLPESEPEGEGQGNGLRRMNSVTPRTHRI